MKKLIYYLLVAAACVLQGCSKSDDAPVPPGLSLQTGVIGTVTAEFTASPTNAERGAYLCVKAADAKPTAADVWRTGNDFDASKSGQYVIDGLQPATDYVLYAVVKNGMHVQATHLAFTTEQSYQVDLQATHARGFYFGNFADNGTGYYLVTLSQKEINDEGLPTGSGQRLFRFFIGSDLAEDADHAQLAPGDFILSDWYGKGSFNSTNSVYIYAKMSTSGRGYYFQEGRVHIEQSTTGEYTIEAEVRLDNGDPAKCSYTGPLTFENHVVEKYPSLKEDVDVKVTGWSGRYTTSTVYDYGNYSITAYNVPLDDEGYIVGAGETVNMELLTKRTEHMDLSTLPGTYNISNGNYVPGTFVEGVLSEDYGASMPFGTYYERYDELGFMAEVGLATDGTITVTEVDTNIFEFDIDLVTATGARVRCTFTGPANITDFTIQAPEVTTPTSSNRFRLLRKNNIWQRALPHAWHTYKKTITKK